MCTGCFKIRDEKWKYFYASELWSVILYSYQTMNNTSLSDCEFSTQPYKFIQQAFDKCFDSWIYIPASNVK